MLIACCVNDYTYYLINPEELLTFHLCVCWKTKQAATTTQQSASSLHSSGTFAHLKTGNSFSPASVDLCGLGLRSTAEGLERFCVEKARKLFGIGCCSSPPIITPKPSQRAQIPPRVFEPVFQNERHVQWRAFLILLFAEKSREGRNRGGEKKKKRSLIFSHALAPSFSSGLEPLVGGKGRF